MGTSAKIDMTRLRKVDLPIGGEFKRKKGDHHKPRGKSSETRNLTSKREIR